MKRVVERAWSIAAVVVAKQALEQRVFCSGAREQSRGRLGRMNSSRWSERLHSRYLDGPGRVSGAALGSHRHQYRSVSTFSTCQRGISA